MFRVFIRLALLLSIALSLEAHVGNPDIYLDAKAGPYQVFITVRPPTVVPGVAELEVRAASPGVKEIRAVPMPMSGPGARFAPVPDQLKVSPQDPQFFTGTLWMMAPGSWQVRVTVTGNEGAGVVAVPVPSAALSTKKMQKGLGAVLVALMTFLVLGVVAIAGASVREAQLPAGAVPDAARKTRGRVAMAVAFVAALGVLWFGSSWWSSEDTSYGENVYKPLDMKADLDTRGLLTLRLHDPGWLNGSPALLKLAARSIDDLIPDHGHLMHLYLIRQPGLDAVFHLHPEPVQGGVFQLNLPTMPEGSYKLYADIVHKSGFPETLVTSLSLAATQGRPLSGDDASGTAPVWNQSPAISTDFALPDGYHMQWINGDKAVRARKPELFRFRLLDALDQAPSDMALYMGMLGHAAFVKTDESVFAHVHPTGSVSMAAFMKAQGTVPAESDMAGMNMEGASNKLPNEVTFPYGLSTPGRYRIFVQMKHGDIVETGVFDARVE
jgi:hypothetical protein